MFTELNVDGPNLFYGYKLGNVHSFKYLTVQPINSKYMLPPICPVKGRAVHRSVGQTRHGAHGLVFASVRL